MNSPFKFGKKVTGVHFCNRKEEIGLLHTQFRSDNNTVLISPRRWGKSSLVEEAIRKFKDEKVVFIRIDLFQCRSEEEFLQVLVKESLKATHNKMEELVQFLSKSFKSLIPFIQFEAMDGPGFSLGFRWNESLKKSEVLDLPMKIANKKKIRLVYCIDEFQNIQFFRDSLAFQRELRSHWQDHTGVHYLLYGIKRHLMVHLFESGDMPFYRFGMVIYLEKIRDVEWAAFLSRKFKNSRKEIPPELCLELVNSMDRNSYYVQQLAFLTWHFSEKKVDKRSLNLAKETLINGLRSQFQMQIDSLTQIQLALLKALYKGERHPTSTQAVLEYGLGSPSSVLRSRSSMVEKGILEESHEGWVFSDPVFRIWFGQMFELD